MKIGNSYIIRDHLEVRGYFDLNLSFEIRYNGSVIYCRVCFCRKPSSSIPKMPPPSIFWVSGESVYGSMLVNKAANRIYTAFKL